MKGMLKKNIIYKLTLVFLCAGMALTAGAYATGMHIYAHKGAKDAIENPKTHTPVYAEAQNVTLEECNEVIDRLEPIHMGLAYSAIASLVATGVGFYVAEKSDLKDETEEEKLAI